MTTEEKAKAYEDALKRAKRLYEGKDKAPEEPILEYLFPELAESEDERMLRKIIDHFNWHSDNRLTHEECDECKAWLEKQKETNEEGDFARGYDCGYECCLNSHGAEWFEKQKEQKPKRKRNKPKESWLEKSKYELAHEEELLIKRQKELREIRALKDKEQKTAEWNKEDEETIRDAINRIEQLDHYWNRPRDEKLIKRLKSLRPQPKVEWSEEDKLMIKCCQRALEFYRREAKRNKKGISLPAQFNIGGYLASAEKVENWLKSLRPQPHWKPSEEQMEALSEAVSTFEGFEDFDAINSLYNDLKKLM